MTRDAGSTRDSAVIAPIVSVTVFLGAWEACVRLLHVPPYLLPAPSLVATTLVADFGSLAPSWWFTVRITLLALALAVAGGVLLAALFALSRTAERALAPFAVVLQVTPIVAIAPLIMIVTDSPLATVLACAWIVAFFPILANTLTGLRSADANLRDFFVLHRASRWQTLRRLLVPAALPAFMTGLRVAGGLALIGEVVAEFVAGAAGRDTGLASRILEAAFRTQIPRMFAALTLVALTGVAIYLGTARLSRALLGRWHESERQE
ncbi:MAG TPA: ABC transporter permease [Burkholderiaceae bacterium]|jgi:NitT/TauT family transport system permease protein|nr:ABC transporter permease [Burkholderiaceae bacterium]